MAFPIQRLRRLRQHEAFRRLVRETSLAPSDFIYPLFVVEGRDRREEIASMPGQFRLSVDLLVKEASEIAALGISAIILFGIPDRKDDRGSSGFDPNGIVQRAVKAVKNQVPELLVVTDVCIDEYTDHGHCGIVKDGRILNDDTLECLCAMARTHAQAGADMVAPSDMMDGRTWIRRVFQNCRLWPMPQSLHPAFMHRFGTRRFQALSSAIGSPTRWIPPIAVKRFGKSRSMLKKGRTSLW
jgi:porphobilinogen synthase